MLFLSGVLFPCPTCVLLPMHSATTLTHRYDNSTSGMVESFFNLWRGELDVRAAAEDPSAVVCGARDSLRLLEESECTGVTCVGPGRSDIAQSTQ